ncbi:hypothetical protein GE21DRAFT_7652 [Neurospora crassa]|uniref:Aldose reductase n=2 Tax=Neurospora crassa TaxID=5141 RepID=Q1K822_NEUCR|nr:aldose reductase [Neurospora crassa OR74A]EAA32363.1 aldose reductase [Neurospora crassa OR74A]KHE87795.1 hypothetical protein GE21DRAFT_7652 [Neurospora crassa]CAB88548.2 related to 2, 5-diketo-D-gluconic acid reductase [Neurospora crassa]|eukprot:XP_961599.1 aldose reductase [Neurospora crassa OR74A]
MPETVTDMLSRRVKLSNGLSIPQIQLGLYMMSGPETTRAVRWALGAGYRGFDSAQWYYNEREAGQAILSFLSSPENTAGLTRKDVHFTSKLRDNSTNYDAVRASISKSVKASGLGYIDLFLLHSPLGGREARLTSWKAVEDAVLAGEVKMAGVSNYGVKHLDEVMSAPFKIKPLVNQIECHPFNTQPEIRAACEKYGIVIEAYAPLARGMRMKHPVLTAVAKKYGVTPAQVLVRWSVQHGFVTLPKSTKKERLVENADVGRFELAEEDMEKLDGLDEKLVTDWDPTDAD